MADRHIPATGSTAARRQRVVGLVGSLRSGSHTRELLRLAADLAPEGVDVSLWEGLKEIPPYDTDDEQFDPAPVSSLRDAVRAADAVVVASPEYNGSIPGQLKNALDWASRPDVAAGPFWGKPVAVVTASTGSFGGVWAQEDLKKVLRLLGARVAGETVTLPRAHERLAEPDLELRAAIDSMWASLGEVADPLAAAA